MTDLDRRKPQAENHVFEGHEPYAEDPDKNYYLSAHRTENDVFIGFVEGDGSYRILNWLHIDADQSEAFGKALIKAAADLRAEAVR